jgi:hypothetical protein
MGKRSWLQRNGQRRCKDEKVQNFLAVTEIHWQFNLSRAPWWGGQFERLIGLVKRALYKTIGGGCLKWNEMQEVLLNVEVALNNRPLSYIEDDIQMPTLTPKSMLITTSPNSKPTTTKKQIYENERNSCPVARMLYGGDGVRSICVDCESATTRIKGQER